MTQPQRHRISDAGLSFDDRASGSYAVQSDHIEDQFPLDYRNRSVSQTFKHIPRTAEEVFHPSAFEQYRNPQTTRQQLYSPIPSEYNVPQESQSVKRDPIQQRDGICEFNEIVGPSKWPSKRQVSANETRYSPNPFTMTDPFESTRPREHRRPNQSQSPNKFRSPERNPSDPKPDGPYESSSITPAMTEANHPSFYDGHTDPNIWFREYEIICDSNSWDSDEIRLRRLIGYLTNAPRTLLMEEKQSNPSLTYQQFKDKLISRFTSTCHEFMVIGKIQRRIQTPTETFEEYWYDKLQLMNAIAPKMDKQTKMNFLVEGLHSPLYDKVLNNIVLSPPKTMDGLFTIIKSFNDVNLHILEKQNQMRQCDKNVENNNEEEHKSQYQRKQSNKRQFQIPDQQYSNFLEQSENHEIKEIKRMVEKLLRQQRRPTERGPCFVCQEIGHYAKDCPYNIVEPLLEIQSENDDRPTY